MYIYVEKRNDWIYFIKGYLRIMKQSVLSIRFSQRLEENIKIVKSNHFSTSKLPINNDPHPYANPRKK